MRKKILALLLCATMVGGVLVGCGGNGGNEAGAGAGNDKAQEVTIEATYVNGKTGLTMDFAGNPVEGVSEGHSLQLLSDGTYVYTVSQVMDVYGSVATINTVTYGTYENQGTEDGISTIKISKATRVIYNAYVGIGGICLTVDTDDESCFPAEFLGTGVKDKTPEDYINTFGPEKTVYTQENSNCLFFENPANAL